MRAKTKEEKLIVDLATKLKPLSEAQIKWAENRIFTKEVWATKNTLTCMECGHQWERSNPTRKTCKCPCCGKTLHIKETQKKRDKESSYFGIITTMNDYQIFRLFMFKRFYEKGTDVNYEIHEAVQKWINKSGKDYTMARSRNGFSMYYDDWIFSRPMSLKTNLDIYDNFTPDYYPNTKFLDTVTRNGYCKLNVSPIRTTKALLSDNRMETLLKVGYKNIFEYFIVNNHDNLTNYWNSIKICLKHNYNLEEFSLWKDYVNMLIRLKKDIRNPQYICPVNLLEAHNNLLSIINKKEEKEREERERLREIETKERNEKRYAEEINAEDDFFKKKSKYLNLMFTDGELVAKPLQSVKDYLEEGTAMHHCVFTCRYYSKESSLVFSVTRKGERIETVEVSLKTGEVIQCYGKYDQFTERHQQVLNLMKANKSSILKRVNLKNIDLKINKSQQMAS